MDENGTGRQGRYPIVVTETPRERSRLLHPATPSADFISQLIAEDQHLPPQRQRRLTPVGTALNEYQRVSQSAVRRLPAGYRRTMLV